MRLETRLPTTVDVDCLNDLGGDAANAVPGIIALVSPYRSSLTVPSFISDLTSMFIGSSNF